jgi:glc operon protein GlcG
MEAKALADLIQNIIVAVEKRVPEYLAIEADRKNNEGNCALCIVDAAGGVNGKMFGPDKIRQRQCFRVAWIKASQVWITGFKTGEYESLVFAGKVDEHKYGISRPDFIGWEGGQPIVVDAQTKLSAGFSGFRGTSDLEIVQKAALRIARANGEGLDWEVHHHTGAIE